MTPRQGLLAALALVLLAGLVVGGENQRGEAHIASAAPPRQAVPAPETAAGEVLEVERLPRAKRSEPIVDVFALKAPPPPPPPPAAPAVQVAKVELAPPPPAPPSLPFRLVGRYVENGMAKLLIANGDKEYNVAGGETLDGAYRVERITEDTVEFTYLPLDIPQTLPLAAQEAGR